MPKIELSGFYTLLDQALVRRPYTLNGQSEIEYAGEISQVLAIQNAAKGMVYGVQAGLEWRISQYFSLTSQYNWQRGNEELDDTTRSPSRHAAPAFGLSRLSFLKKNLRLELTSQYSSKVDFERMPLEEIGKPHLYLKDESGRLFSPQWTIFNIQSVYQLDRFIQIGAGIENIGNIRYRPFSSGIAASGRNFTFSIIGKF
jgi:hemoglobin/transferrin/lactoferrin receptor protein